jgi:group I intron endonuclease
MKIAGIYQIRSKINSGRIYIGSAINIHRRWLRHLIDLKHNQHHSIKFQRHFNKYGEADLQFSILLGCNKEDLLKVEQYFLDSYKPYFNNCLIAGNCLGVKQSSETCKKKSEAHKGKARSEDVKRKISETKKGHKVSEKTRREISLKLTGKNLSEETKHKISLASKGKPHSFEHNRKMGESHRGSHHSEESKRKMSEAKKGKIPWNKGLIIKIA